MRDVMVKAWEIARKGHAKYGGKVSEYFAEALKLAWAIIKAGEQAPQSVEIVTSEGSRNHKSWVAQITGTHPRWKFDRKFIEEGEDDYRDKTFVLGDGVYEVCDAGDREFIIVENGEVEYVEYDEVVGIVG